MRCVDRKTAVSNIRILVVVPCVLGTIHSNETLFNKGLRHSVPVRCHFAASIAYCGFGGGEQTAARQ